MSDNQTNNSRQAAWVAIGSFASFIIGIVSPMILSRYFEKGDYGTYKQVMYVYSTLWSLFTLGLPKAYAYFLPKYGREYSKDIIRKVTNLFFILGALFSLFLFVFAGIIADLLKNPDLRLALIYFSPTPFLLLPTIGLDGIFATFQRTKILAIYTLITRLLTILCIVLPVILFEGNLYHAIIGFDFASLLTCLLALYLQTYPIKKEKHQKSSLKIREIFDFSLPLLNASIWGMIIASANQFFISRYYGNEVFAEYSNGFMEIPFAGMIIGATSAILLPIFSKKESEKNDFGESLLIWNNALTKSAKLIFPILLFSVIYAKIAMICMYGEQYESSSIYFQIKNLSGLLYIVPFAPILLGIGKTKEYAKVHMIIAFLVVLLEYLAVQLFDKAVYVAIVSELCQALKIYLLLKVIALYGNVSVKELMSLKSLVPVILTSAIAAISSYMFVTLVDFNKFIRLILGAIIFAIIYLPCCKLAKITYKDIIGSFIPIKKLGVLSCIIP